MMMGGGGGSINVMQRGSNDTGGGAACPSVRETENSRTDGVGPCPSVCQGEQQDGRCGATPPTPASVWEGEDALRLGTPAGLWHTHARIHKYTYTQVFG